MCAQPNKLLGICDGDGCNEQAAVRAKFGDKDEKLCCECLVDRVQELLLKLHNVAEWIQGRRNEP